MSSQDRFEFKVLLPSDGPSSMAVELYLPGYFIEVVSSIVCCSWAVWPKLTGTPHERFAFSVTHNDPDT